MEPKRASTRMKTKKTKMLMSFKNTFCNNNRQTKVCFEFENLSLKFEFEMYPIKWLYFLHLSNQDISTRAITLASNWFPFQCSKINKYDDHFFSVLFMPYNKSLIDQASSVKIGGYWPCSLFAFLWTSTSSRSIKTQKENSANIQPSWPRAWSIRYAF